MLMNATFNCIIALIRNAVIIQLVHTPVSAPPAVEPVTLLIVRSASAKVGSINYATYRNSSISGTV